jgi:hypothetical protein
MSQPVPLGEQQQRELVWQLGRALTARLAPGWREVRVRYQAAGRHVEADLLVTGPDGTAHPYQPAPDVVNMLGTLRAGMYQPGRGTWLVGELVVRPGAEMPDASFGYDQEPHWRRVPPPIGFRDELATFPRADEHVPGWLRQRLAGGDGETPHGTAQPGTGSHDTGQHGTGSHSIAQHDTGQHGSGSPGHPATGSPGAPFPGTGSHTEPLGGPGTTGQTGSPASPSPGTPAAGPGATGQSGPPFGSPPMPAPGAPTAGPGPSGPGAPSFGSPSSPPPGTPEPGAHGQSDPLFASPPSPPPGTPGSSPTGPPSPGTPAAQGASPSPAGSSAHMRTPRIHDGFNQSGRPVVRRVPLSDEERERVLNYLDGAPVVLAARGYGADAFDPDGAPNVPLNFRTDGNWVWPGAVAYYLRVHSVTPDPDLVEHIRARQFVVPEVDEPAREMAIAAITGGDELLDD